MQIKLGSMTLTITLSNNKGKPLLTDSLVKKIVINAMKGMSPNDNHFDNHQFGSPQKYWKIPAIKDLRDLYRNKNSDASDLGLKEAKDLVEQIDTKYGLSEKYLKGVK